MLAWPVQLPAQGGPSLRYDRDSLSQTWGSCSGGPCVTLRVRYPRITGLHPETFRDSLNVFLQETLLGKYDPRGVAPVVSAVLDSLVVQHRALPADRASSPWLVERTIDVIGDTLGVLSLDVQEFRSTGGAHPVSMHVLYMLQPSTMRVLSLDDLVPAEHRAALTTNAERAFRTVRHLKPGQSLTAAGFTFPGGNFALTLNVALTADGMVFYYNPYEIAPYVMGPTTVIVPWSELGGIVSLSDVVK